jgi:hypothetical protein
VVICFVGLTLAACNTSETESTIATDADTTAASDDPTVGLTEDDLYTLQLNFPESYVVIRGYSSLARETEPNLYRLVYIGLAQDYPALQSDPASMVGSYFADTTDKQIVFPIVHPTTGSAVVQTMKIISPEALPSSVDCTATDFDLSPLTAQSIDCSQSANLANYNRSIECAVTVDATHVLLYQQTSADETVSDNLCETLKANYIQSIELKPY